MFSDSGEKRRASSPTRRSNISSPASSLSSPPRRFSSPPRKPVVYSDRFIPSRLSSQLDNAFDLLRDKNDDSESTNRSTGEYSTRENQNAMNRILRSELLGHPSSPSLGNGDLGNSSSHASSSPNVLRYKSTADDVYRTSGGSPFRTTSMPALSLSSPAARLSGSYDGAGGSLGGSGSRKGRRKISRVPYKVLDAPKLQDDFYLNLVDWSAGNVLAVGLESSVYLWSAYTSKVSKLADFSESPNADTITSVAWMNGGTHLSVGTNSGRVQVWDASTCKKTRDMYSHSGRVGALAWSPQSGLLASGSRDRMIYLQDTRIRGEFAQATPTQLCSPTPPRRSILSARTPPSRAELQAHVYSSPQCVLQGLSPGQLYGELEEHRPVRRKISNSPASSGTSAMRGGMPPRPPSARGSREAYEDEVWESLGGSSVLGADNVDETLVSRWEESGEGMSPPLSPALGDDMNNMNADMDVMDDEEGNSIDMEVDQAVVTPPASPTPGTNRASCLVKEFSAHKQEVCGLKWSPDERQLASGGNDNKLFVWGMAGTGDGTGASPGRGGSRGAVPEHRFADHTAAVKAIAWSPHQGGLLASGGGTADRNIRFWNTHTGTALHSVDTGSQVCNLMWSTHVNEIVSTHGYSLNQIAVWKYPAMQKIATLTGHTFRVLYLAMSPDGQSIVTGAGDETLRFWNIFPGSKGPLGGQGLGGKGVLFPSGGRLDRRTGSHVYIDLMYRNMVLTGSVLKMRK